MPSPTESASLGGSAHVYRSWVPGDPFIHDGNWSVIDVGASIAGRPASATIEFNRARYITAEPSAIPEPIVEYDSIVRIGFQKSGEAGGTLLFEGCPVSLERTDAGTPGARSSRGVLRLESAVETWARHPDRTIIGTHFPRTRATHDDEENDVVRCPSVPCVFNAGGKPNRSYSTAYDADLFADSDNENADAKCHYFADPSGYSAYHGMSTVFETGRARFWTFADAIAYLLWFWFGANKTNPTGEVPGQLGITVAAGPPPGGSSSGAYTGDPWSVVSPYIGIDPLGDRYEDVDPSNPDPFPDPAQFQITPQSLLTARVPGISVEGMHVVKALDTLFAAAGLRLWVDVKAAYTNIDFPPTPIHRLKVTSPGGTLNAGGIGAVFLPRLDPYNRVIPVTQTASQTFADNNAKDVDVAFDLKGTVTKPIIVRNPTLYELTINLRPGWIPIKPINPEDGFAYIDNIDPDGIVVDPGNSPGVNELELAITEARMACQVFRTNIDALLNGQPNNQPTHMLNRVRWMANSLITSGKNGTEYYDVLRKWIIPTDHSYALGSAYARDIGNVLIPHDWSYYTPLNFATGKSNPAETVSVLSTDLTSAIVESELDPAMRTGKGAEIWPQRARPFLPCLVKDRNRQSPGVVVEISFDVGDTWHRFQSIRVATDESAVWLQFQNPFDVQNPKSGVAEKSSNLLLAYLSHRLRVRVTCTIQGDDDVTVTPATPYQTNDTPIARAYPRLDKYRRTLCLSKYRPNIVTRYEDLPDINDPSTIVAGTGTLKEDAKIYVFVPETPRHQMMLDADRVRVWRTGRKVAGTLVIPWIETDASPGSVVPRVDSRAPIGTERARVLEFDDDTINGDHLAPMIVGVTYQFGGNYATKLILEDWRADREQ